MSADSSSRSWQSAGFDRQPNEDLSRFRAAAAGRNVLLVSLESTAAQYLGLYGADPDVMPSLSALARTAVVFDSAYAVYPESIKGLFSILCSAYPLFDRAADAYAGVPCRSLAAVLSERGYRTADIQGRTGKYIVGTEEMGTLVAEALAEFADMRHAYHAV